jgi:hypothetical protein
MKPPGLLFLSGDRQSGPTAFNRLDNVAPSGSIPPAVVYVQQAQVSSVIQSQNRTVFRRTPEEGYTSCIGLELSQYLCCQ